MENNNQPSKGTYTTPEDTKQAAEAIAACLGSFADMAPTVNRTGSGKVIIKINNVHDSFNNVNDNVTIQKLIDLLADKEKQISTLLSIIAQQSKADSGLTTGQETADKAAVTPDTETADKAASAVNDYLGEYTDSVTDLIKLLHLNRAIAKKAIQYVDPYMKGDEIRGLENAYTEYVTQLENAIKSTFSDSVVQINADRLTAI